MKKILLLLFIFILNGYSAGEYHIRVIAPGGNSFTANRVVVDMNNIPEGATGSIHFPLDSHASAILSFNTSTGGISILSSDTISPLASNTSGSAPLLWGPSSGYVYCDYEVRYNAMAGDGGEFDEHDRIIDEIKWIDLEGDGLVGWEDLYTTSVDPKGYSTSSLYHHDKNSDGNVDYDELFTDSGGTSAKSILVEDIPIRSSLPDGSEDDEEDDDEEENSIEDVLANNEELNALKDKLEGFNLDDFDVNEQDLTFNINTNVLGQNIAIAFDGFDTLDEPVPTIKLLVKSIVLLIFSWNVFMSIFVRLGQW